MSLLTQTRPPASFILWEEPMNYSRDNIVMQTGHGVVLAGTVIGMLTQTLAAGTVAAGGSNVGNGGLVKDVSTPLQQSALLGNYTVTMMTATTFFVTDPNGNIIGGGGYEPDGSILTGGGVAGTTWNNEIKFMLSTSSTAFVQGDYFTFPVTGAAGGGQWRESLSGNADGSQVAAAVLIYDVDTTSAAVPVAALTRTAQVNGKLIIYDASVNYISGLAAQGIIVR